MLDGFGRIAAVNGVGLFSVITHAHHLFTFLGGIGQSIPHEFAAGTPGKVTHIVGFVNPGFELRSTFGLFILFGFVQCHNLDRFFGLLGLLPTGVLSRAKQGRIIEAFTGGGYHIIGRQGHFDHKIAKAEGKFGTAGELFVLPSGKIAVHAQARIPLGDGKNVVVFFRKIFVTATREVGRAVAGNIGNVDAVYQIIMPFDAEGKSCSWFDRLGQLNTHHGLVDRIFEGFAIGIDDFLDFAAKFILAFSSFQTLHLVFAHGAVDAGGIKNLVGVVDSMLIFVELQPEVAQGLGRLVVVADQFAAVEAQVVHIECTFNIVITSLLPVLSTRRTIYVAVVVGIG